MTRFSGREINRDLASLLKDKRAERAKLTALLTRQARQGQPDQPETPSGSLLAKLFGRR
jgi:hypothetical protein